MDMLSSKLRWNPQNGSKCGGSYSRVCVPCKQQLLGDFHYMGVCKEFKIISSRFISLVNDTISTGTHPSIIRFSLRLKKYPFQKTVSPPHTQNLRILLQSTERNSVEIWVGPVFIQTTSWTLVAFVVKQILLLPNTLPTCSGPNKQNLGINAFFFNVHIQPPFKKRMQKLPNDVLTLCSSGTKKTLKGVALEM